MALNADARVIATTRSEKRFAILEKLGVMRVELEGPDLSKRIAEAKQLDAADGRWRGQVDLRPKTVVCGTAHLPRL
jgi:hypothetical protein